MSDSKSARQSGSNDASGRPGDKGPTDRSSTSGASAAPKARQSMSQWGPGGAYRQSATVNARPGARASYRQSQRRSTRSTTGDGGGQLQVLDDDGTDRTPKPLLSTKPTALKGAGTVVDDGAESISESSDFFMDRMSNANFGKGSGWYSENNSGPGTPKSEVDEEYDYAAQREKDKKRAEQDAAAMAADIAAETNANCMRGREDRIERGPELLSERDLDKPAYVHLSETDTTFLFACPCVTVAVDSELAREVERNNGRYSHLLATRSATDKYTDTETQTLDLLKKTREVQSAVLLTTDNGCQATAWDIADTYRILEESAAEVEDDIKPGALAAVPGGPSLSVLTQAVARGNSYAPAAAVGGSSASATLRQSVMGGWGGGASVASYAPGMSFARGTFANNGLDRPSGIPRQSAAYASVQGMLPGGASQLALGSAQRLPVPWGPPGGTSDAAAPVPRVDERLLQLPGLLDALLTMDAAVTQNIYLPKLLLYRNIQQNRNNPSLLELTSDRQGNDDDTYSQASASPSRTLSRMASQMIPARTPDMGAARTSQAGGFTNPMPSSASNAGGAGASESSHWPEELLQDLADLGPDGAPSLELLWQWTCLLVEGCNVSCMAWNKARPDLLAVGYGSLSFAGGDQGREPTGRVAFWSLKNPEFPLWAFETTVGVTAIDFATQSPNILAVGLYNGTVAIYDVKARQGGPSMESDATSGRHSDPVWKVRWLDRGAERDEVLVSISTDGRITQWSIAKGLEFADLMKLKRVPRKAVAAGSRAPAAAAAAAAATGAEQHDAFISRHTSGMAFDFSSRDERIYIAGTEDGWIHKCSTSYSEQYLESYQGHMGPIYQLQWSPYRKDMFISASADWTIRLWQEGRDSALLTFQAANNEVNDVQWCPSNSTVFGSVTSGGRLEIWDFGLSTVKPVVQHKAPCKLQCLLFSPTSPVVVCGREDGSVSVFRHFNVERQYDRVDEQLDRLDEVIRANVMKQTAATAGGKL